MLVRDAIVDLWELAGEPTDLDPWAAGVVDYDPYTELDPTSDGVRFYLKQLSLAQVALSNWRSRRGRPIRFDRFLTRSNVGLGPLTPEEYLCDGEARRNGDFDQRYLTVQIQSSSEDFNTDGFRGRTIDVSWFEPGDEGNNFIDTFVTNATYNVQSATRISNNNYLFSIAQEIDAIHEFHYCTFTVSNREALQYEIEDSAVPNQITLQYPQAHYTPEHLTGSYINIQGYAEYVDYKVVDGTTEASLRYEEIDFYTKINAAYDIGSQFLLYLADSQLPVRPEKTAGDYSELRVVAINGQLYYNRFPVVRIDDSAPLFDRVHLPNKYRNIIKITELESGSELNRVESKEDFVTTTPQFATPTQWYQLGETLYLDTFLEEPIWFVIEYQRLPSDLVDLDSAFDIPEEWHEILLLIVEWRTMKRMQDKQRANELFAEINRWIDTLRTDAEEEWLRQNTEGFYIRKEAR